MFFIGAEGLVQDQFSRVLMIQRDDSRTWALPGGGLEANELPSDGMVREVFEETGFKVYPIRLTQLTYIRGREQDLLIFVLRGILRGGAAQTSAESLQVAFVKTDRLPRMSHSHRERLMANLHHPGGPPHLRQQERLSWSLRLLRRLVYRVKDGQRWWRGHLPYVPPNPWYIQAVVILQNEQGQVWWQPHDGGWRLPGGVCPLGQPPWDAAANLAQAQTHQPVTITDLAGVYVRPENQMTLCFVGRAVAAGQTGRWATLEEMGDAAAALPQRFVQDTLIPRETTFFHTISTDT